MRLEPYGKAWPDVEIEQKLIGVVKAAEISQRAATEISGCGTCSEIAFEDRLAVARRDPDLVIVRVKDFDSD